MSLRHSLEQLRRHGRLTLVRGRWCVEHRRNPPEYDEVLTIGSGRLLVAAGLAQLENGGRELVPTLEPTVRKP